MKIYTLLFFSLLFISCAMPKPIALKGNYTTDPKVIETDTEFDKVWDKLIDLFSQKGLSIKIIDRSSGLIISERAALPSTTEKNDGTLKDPGAFAVVPKKYDRYAKKFFPVHEEITGEWNVRIKKAGDKTSINVNIVNIRGESSVYSGGAIRSIEVSCSSCRSTGYFERIISEIIK
jgi:uncharacterized lipoprotein